jgi:hypothetical protein
MPAGLTVSVEKSAPNAPKAPLNPLNRAVPLYMTREYRRASSAVWANIAGIDRMHTSMMMNDLFISVSIECE